MGFLGFKAFAAQARSLGLKIAVGTAGDVHNVAFALSHLKLPQAPPREDEKPPPGAQRVQEALFSNLGEGERKPPELDVDARFTVSDREVLQKKDFAQMTAAEVAAAKDAIKRLVLSLDEVKTRRLAPHRHGHLGDRVFPARRPAEDADLRRQVAGEGREWRQRAGAI